MDSIQLLVLLYAISIRTVDCAIYKKILHNFCENKPDGNYPHPYDCGKFVACEHKLIRNRYEAKVSIQLCPFGLFYDSVKGVCDWPGKVKCFLLQGRTCYGARDNMYGKIYASHTGTVQNVKLVHVQGHVTCMYKNPYYRSYWGCNSNFHGINQKVNTWITTTRNQNGILFPPPKTVADIYGNYYLKGFNQGSPLIKLYTSVYYPVNVVQNQELRVWYGEDLFARTEHDNAGRHCVEVWLYYSYFKSYHPF